jgi:hypothetical protein
MRERIYRPVILGALRLFRGLDFRFDIVGLDHVAAERRLVVCYPTGRSRGRRERITEGIYDFGVIRCGLSDE